MVNKRDCDDLVQKVCDYLAALAAKPPGAGAVILHLDFFEDLQVFNRCATPVALACID